MGNKCNMPRSHAVPVSRRQSKIYAILKPNQEIHNLANIVLDSEVFLV